MCFTIPLVIKRFVEGTLKESSLKSSLRKYVGVFITLFILQGRKWSYSYLGSGVLTHMRNKSNICRLFQNSNFDTASIFDAFQGKLLNEVCADNKVSQDKIWVLVIDSVCKTTQSESGESLVSRSEKKKGKKSNKKRKQKSRRRKKNHIYVKGLLITDKGVRMPLPSRSYRTKKHCRKCGIEFKTQPQIAAEMIRSVKVPEGVKVVVVGDSFFEGDPVHKAVKEKGFYSIFPSDEYRNIEEDKSSKRKSPKKVMAFGRELPDSAFHIVTFGREYDPYAEYTRSPFKRRRKQKRIYKVCKRELTISNLGKVCVVFSKKIKKDRKTGETTFTFKGLITNWNELSPEEVVAIYELRWEIELFFKELKSYLGWDEYRTSKLLSAEHITDLILITFIFLEFFRLKELKNAKGKYQEKLKNARIPKLIEILKKETIKSDLNFIKKRLFSKNGRKTLKNLIEKALVN